ncbi:class I SAM-dependent methyltransferase [Massilia horti]|uniref:SAM-dependent methyltransferase n=1 Tax=Massilia horti TaxID=2562153 RepID=A0A4Y9T4D9_9BURK|nr:class I SAM-dependent methyltransferase [Massilia horti]TFW31822.1 SAM-dependent methyltransferase [Massilia horti]
MQKQHRLAHALLALSTVALLGSAKAAPEQAASAQAQAQYQAAIASPARTDDDRKSDAKRKPAEFLAFAQVRPGMKVLDVAAGGGTTAALLAAAVGPKGEVWAQSAKPSPKLEQRQAALPNLHPVVAPFNDPVPKDAPALDLVTINMSYHDIVNTGTDRAAMNKRLYDALKPGGHLIIIDNAAKSGSGLTATNTLHRIDEEAVVAELAKAGFAVEARSDYQRAPSDPREQPFWEMKGAPDDKFAIRFVKK